MDEISKFRPKPPKYNWFIVAFLTFLCLLLIDGAGTDAALQTGGAIMCMSFATLAACLACKNIQARQNWSGIYVVTWVASVPVVLAITQLIVSLKTYLCYSNLF